MSQLTAKDIMTTDVLKAQADWSLDRLAEFFIENSISGAPVISEQNKLIGVVSLTDIIKNDTFSENDPNSYSPHEYYLHNLENRYSKAEISSLCIGGEPLTTVGDIMTPIIFNVSEDTTIQKVAESMIKNRVHRIFVTQSGNIVGVISSIDMLKIIRDM